MRIPQYSASQFAASFETRAGCDSELAAGSVGLLSPCAGMVITFDVRGGIATTTPLGLRVGIVMTEGEVLALIVYKFSPSIRFITMLSW
jgi:hypothetical protein